MAATGAGPHILVVGAGPTGLLLAAELQRRGVQCLVVDAKAEANQWDRATVVHPRSMELFESLGLIDQFLAAGAHQRGARLHADGEVLGAFDTAAAGSRYEFDLGVSEEITESILTSYLRDHGGEVHRGSKLVGLTVGPDSVRADLEHEGERSEVDVQWVVGCDGLHSPTRAAIGVEYSGHDIAAPWAVFDAATEPWSDAYDVTLVYLDAPPVILTPLPNRRWRIYLRPSGPDSDLVADATGTLRTYDSDVELVAVENPVRFHCHSKVAERFRAGRVLLAGDAAHLCSPAQGHGMNTGLQDAANLAWKLALVVQGAAGPALLDSYEAERRPAAQIVVDGGDDFEQAELLTDPAERAARNQALRDTFATAPSRHHEAVAHAELNIDCRDSPIVDGDADDHVGPGDRFPDTIVVGSNERLHAYAHRAGQTVLVVGAPSSDVDAVVDGARSMVASSPRLEEVVGVGGGRIDAAGCDALGVREVTLFVVRPDGYVGLRADRDHLDALARYDARVRDGGA